MADACFECRFWIDLCAHRKHQDAGRRKYFLGAVSVIYGPVICQFSSAGKHFLHLKTFVWNTYEINMDILFAVCGLTWISTEDYFFVIPYCDHS